MNHPHPGSLATYNSLTDKHLTGYFSNARIRRHLQRSGLISRSGRILSEKEYQLNAMRKDHQNYIRECLAQAIFHKVLDMEHRHQVEIKRKLESSARKERVQRIKVEQSRRSAEDPLFLLSPHPPTAPRNRFGRHRLGDRGQPGHSATHPRPSTAPPGNIQHPVRLQPIYNNATTESTSKATSSSRSKFSPYEKEHHFASVGERGVFRAMQSVDFSSAISPYRLPIINNYVIPVPPPPPPPAPKSDKNTSTKYGTSRGRRFRPTTAPNGLDQLLVKDTGKFYKPQVHSNACVSMIYLGKSVHLSHDLFDYRDEIKIYQQHCGGENVCVYKGKLLEGETFQFISRRHHGFPFSLTFYLNGMQVDRLSSCCEYKHRKGTRLGGKHGHFGFVNVERSSPCYRCIIAMGLDKQPSPPKKKVTDENEGKKEDSRKDDVSHKRSETSSGVGIGEENKNSESQSSSVAGEGKESEEMEVETSKDETRSDDYSDERERNQRCTSDNAYDEDFEADEEKSDEKVNEEGQADDQMNGMSKSPSDDEKDNSDHEKESKNSSQKALQAFDSEQDESDGYSESDLEEDKQDRKRAPSLSPSSTLYSSDNDSESDTRKQDDEKDNTDIHSEYEPEVTETQKEKGQATDVEDEEERSEASNTEAQSAPGHETRMETDLHYMTPVNEELKLVGSQVDTREDRDNVSLEAEHRSKESSDDEREGDCKSLKEKIAEAFGNDPFLSSEPEPSDSSTEDEEENVAATQDKHEVSDGVSLADEELTKHRVQKIVEHEEQERQMVGKDNRALEEEEVGDEVAALEEEFLANNAATMIAEQEVEIELETELEASATDESDLEIDNVEKTITHEKEQVSDSEEETKEEDEGLEGTASPDVASKGDDILYGYQLQREQVEYPLFTEGSLFFGKVSEGTEEAVEAAEMVGTGEETQYELMAEEICEAMEAMKEIVEADEALGTIFVQRDYVEETLTTMEEGYEGSQSLNEREHVAEAIEKGGVTENETMEDMFWKEDEHIEEERFIETEDCFWTASDMEVDPVVFRSRETAEIVPADEKATSSEESIDGGNCFKGEVPIVVEKVVQKVPLTFEVKLEKTSAEAREMNKTIEEDSEREEAESWMEKPLLDWETEGNISAMEENKNDQGENVTVEEWETSDKLNTGREATIEAMVKANETALEEDSLVQDVEEDTGGAEEMTASEEAVPERNWKMEKETFFAEEPIQTVPEAFALVAEETTRRAGKVDVEETEGEVAVKGEVYAEEAEGEVAVKWEEEEEAEGEMAVKEEVEAEEAEGAYKGEVYAEAEKEVAVKEEVEAEEAGEVVKGEVYAEEAEGELKGEVEEEAEEEVDVKGKVEEEAEEEMAVKWEVEEEAEEEVDVKGEVEEEAEEEMAVKWEVEEEAEEEVDVKGEVEEEAEEEVDVKGKVEEEAEEEMAVKWEVEEEAEEEVDVKGEVEEEAEEEVDVKGEVEEEAEEEMAVKWEVEEEAEEEVDVKGEVEEEAEEEVGVKGEVEEEAEEEVDVKWEMEEEAEEEVGVKEKVEAEEAEEEVDVKGEVEEEAEREVTIKGEVFAEDAEREVAIKGEVDVEDAEREVATKEEVEAEEAEREVTVKGEMEVEDPETQGEVVSVDIGPEGKIVSEVTVMGRENVVNILGEKVAEAEKMPESSAQEVALEGQGLTQEKRLMNEPTIQDEVENPSEETAVQRTSIDLQMKREEVNLDETTTEEQMIEGVISLQVMEEALLIGIQQLITDVSQLNVGVEDKEEELEMERLAEDKSSYENPMKEEHLEDVVAKERKIAQSDEADQRGTEHGKEIHLEGEVGRGDKKIEAGDYPVENLLWTETIPLSAGGEQQHELSAQIINLEPAGMSDLKDEH